jgi:hypothetical protein
VKTHVARHARVQGDRVTWFDVGYCLADYADDAPNFMTEHLWRWIQRDAAIEQVQIRGANTASNNVNDNV